MTATTRTDAEVLEILQRPFPSEVVRIKGRFQFISHGLITERLTEADPFWESVITNVHTYTGASGELHCAGVVIHLTINFPEHGAVTRTESGGPQRQESFALEIKNAQSDALKRAAMRFGVALQMWESLVDAIGDEDYAPEPAPMRNVNGQRVGRKDLPKALSATEADLTTLRDLATRLGDPDPVSPGMSHEQAVVVIKTLSQRLSKAPARHDR